MDSHAKLIELATAALEEIQALREECRALRAEIDGLIPEFAHQLIAEHQQGSIDRHELIEALIKLAGDKVELQAEIKARYGMFWHS